MANLPLTEIAVPDSDDIFVIGEQERADIVTLQNDLAALEDEVEAIPTKTLPQLTAGSIISDKYSKDEVPYLFRAIKYNAKRLEDCIVGGTVVFNQIVSINSTSRTATSNNVTLTDNRDGSYKIQTNGSASANTSFTIQQDTSSTAVKKDDIYACFGFGSPSGGSYRFVDQYDATLPFVNVTTDSAILKATSTGRFDLRIQVLSGVTISTPVTVKPQVINLTKMFGSTIADYIYSLEQATAGAGVAWFKKLFPKDYYAYNAGELLSVKTSKHITTGFNQMPSNRLIKATYNTSVGDTLNTDAPTTSITGENPITINATSSWQGGAFVSDPMVKDCQYQLTAKVECGTATNLRLTAYIVDKDYKVIYSFGPISSSAYGNLNYTYTPTIDGARFVLYVANYSPGIITVSDLCVHLAWDNSRNGKYFPYEEHTYPLGDVVLRGIPKLVNNELVYDGDIYTHDGAVTRRFAVVTVDGSENWVKSSTYNGNYYCQHAVEGGKTNTRNIVTSNGLIPVISTSELSSNDLCVMIDGGSAYALNIKNTSKTTLTDFKSWLADNPITVVYELATPTTETSTPFEQYQVCETGGTEEYTTTNDVPVGHDTKYFTDVIGNIEDIPAPPTADGTYTLKVTVSSGVPTYAWV